MVVGVVFCLAAVACAPSRKSLQNTTEPRPTGACKANLPQFFLYATWMGQCVNGLPEGFGEARVDPAEAPRPKDYVRGRMKGGIPEGEWEYFIENFGSSPVIKAEGDFHGKVNFVNGKIVIKDDANRCSVFVDIKFRGSIFDIKSAHRDMKDNIMKFSGKCEDNLPNGKGRLDIFRGNQIISASIGFFINGYLSGSGEIQEYSHSDTNKITSSEKGEFLNGQLNGYGVVTSYKYSASGSRFISSITKGNFSNGQKDGDGEWSVGDEEIRTNPMCREQACVVYYKGEFKNDLRHGHGTIKFSNGDSYEGSFIHNSLGGPTKFQVAERQAAAERQARAEAEASRRREVQAPVVPSDAPSAATTPAPAVWSIRSVANSGDAYETYAVSCSGPGYATFYKRRGHQVWFKNRDLMGAMLGVGVETPIGTIARNFCE